MGSRNIDAGELNRLAEALHTLATLADADPGRTAIANVAGVVSDQLARGPGTIEDVARRTGLPRDLVRRLAVRQHDDRRPADRDTADGNSGWVRRCDAALDLLAAELFPRMQ